MINDLIARILSVGGILEKEADLKLEELRQEYPDLQGAYDAFLKWVQPQLEAILDPQTALGLVGKIASEFKGGHPSYDPGHWTVG